MRSLFTPGLIAAVSVYVLLRALLLHTAFDETVMQQYELYPMGTIPKILFGAGEIPLHFHYDNAAGQLFTGVVAWPLYALFGDSYLVLKLVPALLGLAGLVFLHLFLRENFSERAATIGSLLFALGPVPTMMKYSVFAGGNHFEHIPFAIFTLWCFYRLHREHDGADRRWLFITGLAMGFQLFILLGAAIPILLLGLVHLGQRGLRGALTDLRSLVPGAVIGMSPLFVVNWASRGRGGGFLGAKFEEGGPSFSERVWEFAVERIDQAAAFDDFLGMPASVAAATFFLVSAVAWFAAAPRAFGGAWTLLGGLSLWRFNNARFVPLFLYFPAVVVVYGLTNFELKEYTPPIPMQAEGYRYYLPHFLFVLCLIAIVADRWLAAGGGKRIAGGALVCGGFFAASFNLTYMDLSCGSPGAGARYEGYNFVQTARALYKPTNVPAIGKFPGKWDEWRHDREAISEIIDSFEPPWRQQLYIGAGWCEAQKQYMANAAETEAGSPFLDTREFLPAYAEDVQGFVARGAGLTVRIFWQENSDRWSLAEWITLQTPRADPAIAEVIAGANIPYEFPHSQSEFRSLFNTGLTTLGELDPQRAEQFARGLGHFAGVVLERGIPGEVAELEELYQRIPIEQRNAFMRGVGEQLAIAGESPHIPSAAFDLEAPEGEEMLRDGFERSARKAWGEEAERLLVEAEQGSKLK